MSPRLSHRVIFQPLLVQAAEFAGLTQTFVWPPGGQETNVYAQRYHRIGNLVSAKVSCFFTRVIRGGTRIEATLIADRVPERRQSAPRHSVDFIIYAYLGIFILSVFALAQKVEFGKVC